VKHCILLMSETGRGMNVYTSLHYIGERSPVQWFKLPIGWVDAVKLVEVNGYHSIDYITPQEMILNGINSLTIVLFDSENNFQKVVSYKQE
jgi:hypothetical protein